MGISIRLGINVIEAYCTQEKTLDCIQYIVSDLWIESVKDSMTAQHCF